MLEYNDNNFEQQTQDQTDYSPEVNVFVEAPTFDEMEDVEDSAPKPKVVKKRFDYAKLMSAIMTVVMAGVSLGVGVILPVADVQSPLNDVALNIREFGANSRGEVYYHLEITSKAPFDELSLTARLYNDFTDRSTPLVIEQDAELGYAGGSFEGLKVGVTYTFAVVGKATLGDKEIFTKKVTIPHPVEEAYANVYDYSFDTNAIYCTVDAYSDVPLEIVLRQNGVETHRIPFDNTSGGTVDGNPDAPYSGTMYAEFQNVAEGANCTLLVVGKGLLNKEYVVTTYTYDPVYDATADVVECAVRDNAVIFNVEAYSQAPLEIVLKQNGEETHRIPFDNTSGGMVDGDPNDPYSGMMSGAFSNVSADAELVILIFGKDVNGNDYLVTTYNVPTQTT